MDKPISALPLSATTLLAEGAPRSFAATIAASSEGAAASAVRALEPDRVENLALINPGLARAIANLSVSAAGLLRTELTGAVSPAEELTDLLLYEDAHDASQKFYLPRYRIAEQTVSGKQQYRMSLEPSGSEWKFTIYFEKYPAPEIEIAARTAQELPHEISVALRYQLMVGSTVAAERELVFPDVVAEPPALRASLRLSRLEERDQLYQALTESAYGTSLIVRRAWRVAIPLKVPDSGAFTLSSGSASMAGSATFGFDHGSEQAGDADVRFESTADSRRLVPQAGAQIASLGLADFEAVTPQKVKALSFGTQPVEGAPQIDANAVIIATPNWNPGGAGGTYDPHSIGIYFTGLVWSMFNQDIVAMPVNAAFNILALPPGDSAFVHRATGPHPGWSGWINLGAPAGSFQGAVTTVARSPGVCNVYARGSDNALWQKAFFSAQWFNFGRHEDGGVLSSSPAAGTMGPNHEHIFVQGTDGQLWQKWWTNTTGWSAWVPLGAPPVGFQGAPAVISRSPDVCNVYVWGNDNALWQKAFFGSRWVDWTRHNDGVLASAPAVSSQGPAHEEVFVRGIDKQLWHKWWTSTGGWSSWLPLGTPAGGFQGGPAAVWRNSSNGNVYVRGADNAVWERKFEGGQWLWWERHANGVLTADPAVGSMAPEHEHLFVRGTDGNLWQQWWPSGTDPGNISGNSTFLDHPKVNGNPNVILNVLSSWNPGGAGGVYDNHHIGVWYNNGKWAIYNQDLAAMPMNAAFNVHASEPGPNAFVHRAAAANITGHITVIDHPQTNGNANAILLVTPNWNAGGAAGVYNNHPIGVYYFNNHWAIFNQDIGAMPAGAAFNVQVFAASPTAFVHRATAANIGGHTSLIARPTNLDKGTVLGVKTRASNYAKAGVSDAAVDLKLNWVTYSDEPRYKDGAGSLEDKGTRHPFVFPPDLYGYIFRGISSVPTNRLGLIRQTVAWKSVPHVYFQDQARQNIFYYLPDEFKIARAPGEVRHPFLSVDFSSPDGSLDRTTAVVEYFALPSVDRDRLAAAVAGLRQFVPSGGGEPSLELLLSNQVKFKLGLSRADDPAVIFAERPEALVSLRDGIHHSLSFSIQQFQSVFDAFFSDTSTLFQGQVLVSLGEDNATEVPPIPFIARMDDLVGDLFAGSSAPGATADSLQVTLRNAIESPVTVRGLGASLGRGGTQVPARVELTMPANVAPGASVTVGLTPSSPLPGSGAPEPVFDLSAVDVKPDREAIWGTVLKQTARPDYIVTVRVRTVRELFDPPADHSLPPIGLIVVELKIGDERSVTVELTLDQLQGEARLHRSLKDFVLGKADDGSYSYRVTAVRGGSRPDNPPWKTASQDLLLILSPDVS
jgi:hypothetical protein